MKNQTAWAAMPIDMDADKTMPEQIADRVRRAILRGVFQPGDPIKERDTADLMSVSRTPMREAIRLLAQEGLIELRPARSPRVATPDFKTLKDQAIVLIALEKLAAQSACLKASDADIARLSDALDAFESAFETYDAVELFERDMAFHEAAVRASGNETLIDMHGTLLRRLWRARYLSARQSHNRAVVVTEHRHIVEALARRDSAQVADAIEAHLGGMVDDFERVREALNPFPET